MFVHPLLPGRFGDQLGIERQKIPQPLDNGNAITDVGARLGRVFGKHQDSDDLRGFVPQFEQDTNDGPSHGTKTDQCNFFQIVLGKVVQSCLRCDLCPPAAMLNRVEEGSNRDYPDGSSQLPTMVAHLASAHESGPALAR